MGYFSSAITSLFSAKLIIIPEYNQVTAKIPADEHKKLKDIPFGDILQAVKKYIRVLLHLKHSGVYRLSYDNLYGIVAETHDIIALLNIN